MNATNVEHAAAALLMQISIGLATGNWWAGAAAGTFFFLGREHAQFEKKLTKCGPVGGLNPLAGLQFWKWGLDGQLDLAAPAVATLGVAVAYEQGADPIIVSLYLLLVALGVMDAMMAANVYNRRCRVRNPIMTAAMRAIGAWPALALSKTVVLTGALLVALRSPYAPHILATLCAIYTASVAVKWRDPAAWA